MSRRVTITVFLTLALALSGVVLKQLQPTDNNVSFLGMATGLLLESVNLRNPVRIALDDDGNLYVTDYTQSLVATLDTADLSVIKAFRIEGKPLGVAWGRGRLFVGNTTTKRVEIYTTTGKLQDVFDAVVANPTDISFDGLEGLVFVLDGQENTVMVFNYRGEFLNAIPAPGEAQEGLVAPTALAVDSSRGEILISDYGNVLGGVPASIKVYGYDGMFRFKVSGDAVQSGYRFSRPQGLYVGTSGNIYMADAVISKVMVFDRNTRLGIASMGGFGEGVGKLMLPLDIAIVPDTGDIFVTDNRNARVEVFRGGGLR